MNFNTKTFQNPLSMLTLSLMLLFTLGAGASGVLAADAAPLVETGAGSNVDITVYGRSFAQIEESRTITLQAGKNRIQLNGISGQYTPDSLRIVEVTGPGDFKYNSATYQPANLNRDQILLRSVGEQVTVIVGSGANATAVTGKLISANGGQLIVVDGAGKTYMTGSGNAVVDKLPAGLSNTASLVVEATVDKAGSYEMRFFYESRGFSWAAKHSLIFNEEASRLDQFQTTVNVVNNSGTTFDGANLWLLSGNVPQNAKSASFGASYRAQSLRDSAESSVESVGERKVYKIPGTVDLIAGQSRQIPLFSTTNVPVDKEFLLQSWDYQYQRSDNLAPVNVQLHMKNCVKSNMGMPLPAATVKVYQANSAGNLQLTATTSAKELALDEQFTLDIGTSSDVKAMVKMVKNQEVDANGNPLTGQLRPNNRGPRYYDRQWSIKVHNFKTNTDVDVTVKAQLPSTVNNVSPFTRESASIGTTKLKVLKTDSTELNYGFRVRTN